MTLLAALILFIHLRKSTLKNQTLTDLRSECFIYFLRLLKHPINAYLSNELMKSLPVSIDQFAQFSIIKNLTEARWLFLWLVSSVSESQTRRHLRSIVFALHAYTRRLSTVSIAPMKSRLIHQLARKVILNGNWDTHNKSNSRTSCSSHRLKKWKIGILNRYCNTDYESDYIKNSIYRIDIQRYEFHTICF